MGGVSNISYILFAYLGLFVLGIIDNTRGPIYPEILQQFQVSTALGSSIFSLSSLSSFIITLFASKWNNKLGAVNSLKFAVLTHLIAVVLMGVSAKYQGGFWVFLFASALFGIGVGMMSISQNLIVNEFSPVLKRRKFFAGLHSMYGLASLLAPLLMSFVFTLGIAWQDFLLALAIIPLVSLIYSLRLPKQEVTSVSETKGEVSWKLSSILGVILSFYVASEVLLSSRMAYFLRTHYQYDAAKASEYLGIFFMLLLAGRMLFALFHFRIKAYHLLLISAISSLISFLLGLFYHPLFLVICGLTMSFFFPNAMEWVSEKYENESQLLITRMMIFVGAMLVSMHWMVGGLSDLYNIHIAMMLGPLMLICVIYLLHVQR